MPDTVWYTQFSTPGAWHPVTIDRTFRRKGLTFHVVVLREDPPPAILCVREPNQLKRVDEIPLSEVVYVVASASTT